MDDANVPSLLSLPYLECIDIEDKIYQNTRKYVLSNKTHIIMKVKLQVG